MRKLLIILSLSGVLCANKCFILTSHYTLFSENEKKAYLAGLQDRFDYEIRNGNYRLKEVQMEYLKSHTIEDIRRIVNAFIEKNRIFQGKSIESYCLSDIFGFIMEISLKNKLIE